MSSELLFSFGAEPCGELGIVPCYMCSQRQRKTRTRCRAVSQHELSRAFLWHCATDDTLSLKEVKLMRHTIVHGQKRKHIETHTIQTYKQYLHTCIHTYTHRHVCTLV